MVDKRACLIEMRRGAWERGEAPFRWALRDVHVTHRGAQVSEVVRQLSEVLVSVSISYNLAGNGWSECTVDIDEHHATVKATAVTDGFGDLLSAVIRLVAGYPQASVSFDDSGTSKTMNASRSCTVTELS
jgi:hypothetical protein